MSAKVFFGMMQAEKIAFHRTFGYKTFLRKKSFIKRTFCSRKNNSFEKAKLCNPIPIKVSKTLFRKNHLKMRLFKIWKE